MADFKLTSYSDGFGIFNKVSEEEFDVINKNYIRMFMLRRKHSTMFSSISWTDLPATVMTVRTIRQN